MKSHTTERFRAAFRELPERIQRSATRAYRRFEQDPSHPALRFKKIHDARNVYCVRVSLGYRALGIMTGDEVIWFWIGAHAEYDQLVSQLRRGS